MSYRQAVERKQPSYVTNITNIASLTKTRRSFESACQYLQLRSPKKATIASFSKSLGPLPQGTRLGSRTAVPDAFRFHPTDNLTRGANL